MMSWLAILAAVIKAVSALTSYLKDKQAIDAGTAQAVAAQLKGAIDEIQKATSARDAVRAIPVEQLRDEDPDSRD
jgi:hypothetical protein